VNYRVVSDLWYPIPTAILVILVRSILERLVSIIFELIEKIGKNIFFNSLYVVEIPLPNLRMTQDDNVKSKERWKMIV
jgi:hypothetical protein